MEICMCIDGKGMNVTRTMKFKIWMACQDQTYGRMMELCRKMCKGHGKCIWIGERKVKGKIKEGRRMMNGKWKDRRYVWKSGRDGACPQCRVQVEEEK